MVHASTNLRLEPVGTTGSMCYGLHCSLAPFAVCEILISLTLCGWLPSDLLRCHMNPVEAKALHVCLHKGRKEAHPRDPGLLQTPCSLHRKNVREHWGLPTIRGPNIGPPIYANSQYQTSFFMALFAARSGHQSSA